MFRSVLLALTSLLVLVFWCFDFLSICEISVRTFGEY